MGRSLSRIVEQNANASLYGAEIVPAVPGPMIWMTGAFSSIDLASRNWASGKKFTPVGPLVVTPNYVKGKTGSRYFRSLMFEPLEWTHLFYGRRDDTSADNAHTGAVIGSYAGASQPGMINFFPTGVAGFRAQAFDQSGQRTATVPVTDPTLMKKYVSTCSTAQLLAACTTDGTSSPATNFLSGRRPGELAMRVLASNSGVFMGEQGHYHQALYPRILTTEEIGAHWAQVDLHAARDGVIENS